MKKLMLSLSSCAIFAVALAASSNADAQPGKKGGGGGGGGKSFNPPPRVTVVPAKNVTINKAPVTKVVVNPPAARVIVNTPAPRVVVNPPAARVIVNNPSPAVRVNANINLGPARIATRINYNPAPRYVNYNHTHGVRFAQGTYYRGRDHRHWSVQRWDARYRCYLYYDPCVRGWYYWNQPMACYYPVSYCPTGSYASPIAAEPLPDVPFYPTDESEPVNAPIGQQDNGFPPMDESQDADLPPIPEPLPMIR